MGAAAVADLAVEGLGLRLGLDRELAREEFATDVELAQRRLRAAMPGIEAHQRPVRLLLQRLERKEPERDDDGPVAVAGLGMAVAEPAKEVDGAGVQAVALGEHPVLEARRPRIEAVEEVAAVAGRRGLQVIEGGSARGRLEGDRIDFRGPRRQHHLVRRRRQRLGAEARGLPQAGQALFQTSARLGLVAVLPQHGRELAPGMRPAGSEGEIDEEGLGLARRVRNRAAGSRPDLDAAERDDTHVRHGAPPCIAPRDSEAPKRPGCKRGLRAPARRPGF